MNMQFNNPAVINGRFVNLNFDDEMKITPTFNHDEITKYVSELHQWIAKSEEEIIVQELAWRNIDALKKLRGVIDKTIERYEDNKKSPID